MELGKVGDLVVNLFIAAHMAPSKRNELKSCPALAI
jgi:hypothetical protein